MSGTKAGGKKAKITNLQKHGKDFYKRIGAMGGRVSGTGGFASMFVDANGLTGPERASAVGVSGGERKWTNAQRKKYQKTINRRRDFVIS